MRPTRRNFLLAGTAALAGAPAVQGAPARAVAHAAKWTPKLSENLADVNPETLRWLKQLGCKHVIFQGTDRVDADRKGFWTEKDVREVKRSCEAAGMILESMMIPIDFYKKARFGQ